jgi:hypothetical protein
MLEPSPSSPLILGRASRHRASHLKARAPSPRLALAPHAVLVPVEAMGVRRQHIETAMLEHSDQMWKPNELIQRMDSLLAA